MITILLIISALAGAAGLYTLFRENPEPAKKQKNDENQDDIGFPENENRGLEYSLRASNELSEKSIQKQKSGLDTKLGSKKEKGSGVKELKKTGELKLTYDADEIIPNNSRYSFHRRPLLNAEVLLQKGNLEGAMEILARVEERIPDSEIKTKINQNINDIKEFLEEQKKENSYEPDDSDESKGENQGTISEQESVEELLRTIQEITGLLAKTLEKGLGSPITIPEEILKKLPTSSGSKDENVKVIAIPFEMFGKNSEQNKNNIPGLESLGNTNQNPIVYQFFGNYPENLPQQIQNKDSEKIPEGKELLEDLAKWKESALQEKFKKAPLSNDFSSKETDYSKESGDKRDEVGFNPQSDKGIDKSEFNKGIGDPSREGENEGVPKPGESDRNPYGGLGYIPPEGFFDKEWDHYKNLPLKDRRSGKDRRQSIDRRNSFDRKDRRSGIERRKNDLFKNREDFLKKKFQEKLEEKYSGEPLSDEPIEDKIPENITGKKISPSNFPFPMNPTIPLIPLLLPGLSEVDSDIILSLPSPHDKKLFNLNEDSDYLPEPITPEDLNIEGIHPESVSHKLESSKNALSLPDPLDYQLRQEKDQETFSVVREASPPPDQESFFEKKNEPDSKDLIPSSKVEDDSPYIPIQLPNPIDTRADRPETTLEGVEHSVLPVATVALDSDASAPEIEVLEGSLGELDSDVEEQAQEGEESKKEPEPEKMIHGILELKPPEVDDAPFLTLTYDFSKIPHSFRLSKNYSTMEYSYYKYKPMLVKAQEFARRKMLKNALNYYRVIKAQNIPTDMKKMVNRNIRDITEFMEKYLMTKGSNN